MVGGVGDRTGSAPVGTPPLPPLRALGARLLPLPSRRCRACVARGLPGLLVSPAEPPAAPPQPPSLKLYRKHCAAALLLPWLTLLPPGAAVGRAPPAADAADAAVASHVAAALLAAGGGRAPRLPLVLHVANPFDAPAAVVVHLGGGGGGGDSAAPFGSLGGCRTFASLGGCRTPWRRGQLEGGEPGACTLTLLLQGHTEEEEVEEGQEGARPAPAEEEAWAAFPWPPGAPPPPWRRGGGGDVAKHCAAAPVVLSSAGDFSEGVEVLLRVSVFLHPAALSRWQGVAPLAHATLVPLSALLRVPPAAAGSAQPNK